MALKNLRHNIKEAREVVREMVILISQRELKSGRERELLTKTIDALAGLLAIINNSIPALADNISPFAKIGKEEEVKELVNVVYKKGGVEKNVTINQAERKRFFDQLNLSNFAMKRIRKDERRIAEILPDFKKPSFYAKISNRIFSRLSNNLIERGHCLDVGVSLRKANIPFILNTYISIVFFTTLLAAGLSVILFIFLMFFTVGLESPFISAASDFTFTRIFINFLICAFIPIACFFSVYYYPRLEAGSIGKKINQELPFVTMHMSAIAGSGIEPTQIFKIIAVGKEYPNTKNEIKKVINQVNVYGYDLVNALKNSAKSTSNSKLSELFNGLATAISTGGSLTDFLDQRTESLLFDYKLERERSTKTAETFMDIYISVVIAAPMILMILLILLSVGPLSIGLGINEMTLIIISIVALINFIFLGILQLKQPGY